MKVIPLLVLACFAGGVAIKVPPPALSRNYRQDAKPQSAEGVLLQDLSAGLVAFSEGGLWGYAGAFALSAFFDVLGAILSKKQRQAITTDPAAIRQTDLGTIEGRWLLDAKASESLEPFLVAVGAPRLVAKLVGTKGKPMELRVRDRQLEGLQLMVHVEGKDPEMYCIARSTAVRTPRGLQQATLTGDEAVGFHVVKRGPAEGESVKNSFELCDGGRRLRCIYAHRTGGSEPVTVTRYYERAHQST
jgi:hypothetical protein